MIFIWGNKTKVLNTYHLPNCGCEICGAEDRMFLCETSTRSTLYYVSYGKEKIGLTGICDNCGTKYTVSSQGDEVWINKLSSSQRMMNMYRKIPFLNRNPWILYSLFWIAVIGCGVAVFQYERRITNEYLMHPKVNDVMIVESTEKEDHEYPYFGIKLTKISHDEICIVFTKTACNKLRGAQKMVENKTVVYLNQPECLNNEEYNALKKIFIPKDVYRP